MSSPTQPVAKGTLMNDPVSVDPQRYSVEFENEHVRVLRIRYAPGEESVMHGHPNSVAVVLSDGKVAFSFPDGRCREADVKTGEFHWHPAGDHQPKNIGETPLGSADGRAQISSGLAVRQKTAAGLTRSGCQVAQRTVRVRSM